MALETVSTSRSFGGVQGVYKHAAAATGTDMTFSVYVPEHDVGAKLPVVWYLSGLTCTHANVTEKGEYRRACAELGLIFIAPDTSPRGEGVPDDPQGAYDFGLGAGFYVDATQEPFAQNYRMWTYITRELPELVAANFPIDERRQAIMGHSMGGMGRSRSRWAILIVSNRSAPFRRSWPQAGCLGARRPWGVILAPIRPPGVPTMR